jgi:hypothetical protein
MHEPVVEPPQGQNRLQPGGYGPGSNAHMERCIHVTPRSVNWADQEATLKACGVGVARLQGKSRLPNRSTDQTVKVGTVSVSPSHCAASTVAARFVVG